MDFTTGLATVALLMSLATGSVQLHGWWQTRHRVSADCAVQTRGTPLSDGTMRTEFFPVVTLRNAGAATGVEDIAFKWLSPPGPPPEGFGWGPSNQQRSITAEEAASIIDPLTAMGVRRQVADGEVTQWSFVVHTSSRLAASQLQEFQAEIHLASGKTIRTNKFSHQPTYRGPGESPPSVWNGDPPTAL